MLKSRRRSRQQGLILLLVVLLLLLFTACDQTNPQESTVAPTAQDPGHAWLLPTPTLASAVLTPTVGPTPTLTPPPTPTPLPEVYVAEGVSLIEAGNYDEAARALQAALSEPGSLERTQQVEALWALARAYHSDARHGEALETLRQVERLVQPPSDGNGPLPGVPAEAERRLQVTFLIAQTHAALGDCPSAVEAYESYLAGDEHLAAYVYPRIAACHQEQGDAPAAIAAFEAAVDAPAHRLVEVENRLKLAELQLAAEDIPAAVAQYDAVRDLAQTENTRAEMTYLAGRAELQAGNTQAAYERFQQGINDYPGSYYSYLGLIELVDAGVAVDAHQRGLVDYFAQAYDVAIAAFDSHIQANPDTYRSDARLYLAWCYEGLGNLEAALAQLDAYAQLETSEEGAPYAARALVERGRILARAGQAQNAVETYQALLADYPDSEHAPHAAWWSAVHAEQLGNVTQAREFYLDFGARFPAHEDAPRALFKAGMLAWQEDDTVAAQESWERLVNGYTQSEYGAAALIWLMRSAPDDEAEPYVITATNLSGAGYYALRARDLASGTSPFEAPEGTNLQADEEQEQADAESWLAAWTDQESAVIRATLPAALTQDPRVQRGQRLWNLGLYAQGKQELEAVRQAFAADALATYQLALYFRDLGLYRSSILAADTLLRLSGQTVFEAPRLIGRLSYPVYYQDLILELAADYGYDPLLQFSLVRQESLYESFIASHAGAQGLSQVMPATGEDIARRLGWPGYRTEDLHRPYVGLAFGAYYLDQQLQHFDGDVYAALSAYNAGPGNAARWYALAPHDPDLYLEVVDFNETRTYLQRIYSGYSIYRWLYGDL